MSPGRDRKPLRSVLLQAVPNLLTLTRLALGIAFPLIPARWRVAALLVAAATEFLDGQIARLLRVKSATGRILDPIADKVFVASVLVTLLVEGAVKPWQLILVVSRDIVVTAGAVCVAARRGISALREMHPVATGKAGDSRAIRLPPRGSCDRGGESRLADRRLGAQRRGGDRLCGAIPLTGGHHRNLGLLGDPAMRLTGDPSGTIVHFCD